MFKSHAQARKVKELVKTGKIQASKAMEWWHKTDFKNLPDRIHGKKPR